MCNSPVSLSLCHRDNIPGRLSHFHRTQSGSDTEENSQWPLLHTVRTRFFFYFKELRLGGFCFYPSVTETILINRGIIPPWICYEAGIRRRKRDWYHKKKWKICFLELIFWIKYKTHSYITTGPNLANIMGNLNEIFTPVWKWNNHIVYNVSVNSNWHACSNHKSVTTRAQGSLFYSLNTCL